MPKYKSRDADAVVTRLRELVLHGKLNVTRVAADLGVVEGTVRQWLTTGNGPKNALVREALDKILAAVAA